MTPKPRSSKWCCKRPPGPRGSPRHGASVTRPAAAMGPSRSGAHQFCVFPRSVPLCIAHRCLSRPSSFCAGCPWLWQRPTAFPGLGLGLFSLRVLSISTRGSVGQSWLWTLIPKAVSSARQQPYRRLGQKKNNCGSPPPLAHHWTVLGMAYAIICSSAAKLTFATAKLAYDTPLWHNVAFRNDQRLSYFRPALIQTHVFTVGQLLEDDAILAFLAPSTRPIC